MDSDPKMKENRYILFTGAPGSRWSSVANGLYQSCDLDTTDQSDARSYEHNNGLRHSGSYFDPEMEYDFFPSEFHKPFSGEGRRLIKSHTLATQLEMHKQYPIVLVYRSDIRCLDWWNECGGFDIEYPNYSWYREERVMFSNIQRQNHGIMRFIYNNRNRITECVDNFEVLTELGLDTAGVRIEGYEEKDVTVYVYKPPL